MPRVTLKDIATRSDVSIGTVSRVLSRKPDVHPAFVHRVMEAVDELGYNKHLVSKADILTKERPAQIGLLINKPQGLDYHNDAFESVYLESVANHLAEKDIHLLFEPCSQLIARDSLPRMIQSNCVQGVIIKDVEWQHAVWVRRIAEHVPVVVLGVGTDAEYIGVNSVLCDNALAMHNAVSFVKSLGHQRVAFFNVVNQGSSVIHHCQRGQGFRAALNRLGMLQHPDYFQEPEHNNAIESMDAVAKRVLEYWLAMGDERPTAIIGVSDAHAMAMMQASYQLGLDIPGDMTVIGCMNTPDAQLCRPALTSVGFPGGEIGRMAVDLLLDVIENPSQPHRQLLLGAEVIERQSHRAC